MKMPLVARERFDALLVRPLRSTRTHKKEAATFAAGIGEGRRAQNAERLGRLLASVERKTSPLYVRQIHALADYLVAGHAADDAELEAQVIDAVCHSTRRFELIRGEGLYE